jgi:hypothetical protein
MRLKFLSFHEQGSVQNLEEQRMGRGGTNTGVGF